MWPHIRLIFLHLLNSSLWRALNGPLNDSLLSVCDARTIERDDLMAHDLVYSHYVGENFQLKYNPKQRWYFLDGMEANEAILFKNFDSITDGRARRKSAS